MTTIRGEQHGGRYSRPAAWAAEQVRRIIRSRSLRGHTETHEPDRYRATKAPGWGVWSKRLGDLGETTVAWRYKTWQPLDRGTDVIAPDLGPGGRSTAAWVAVRHRRGGFNVVLITAHLPASVEDDIRAGRSTARTRAHGNALSELDALSEQLGRRFDALVVVTPDVNLNAWRTYSQAWLNRHAPHLRLVRPLPKRPTHGDRLIDWLMVNDRHLLRRCRLVRVGWRVRRFNRSSDHAPFVWWAKVRVRRGARRFDAQPARRP